MSGMPFVFHDAPGFLIRRLHQISVSVLEARLSDAGLDLTPVQVAALSALSLCPDIDQVTLAGVIAYDRVTIGGVVGRLVDKGYVSRSASPHDRRAFQLALTRSGRAILRDAEAIAVGLEEEVLGGLTAREREIFKTLLKKTADAGNEKSRAPLRMGPALTAERDARNEAPTIRLVASPRRRSKLSRE
ncbi:MAG: MarR family transcriptional regulator [Hyphomonadaceae bacterium]|nr:MarR family transcriptional regulator [Hyphomonadaceae bacterium]